MPMAAEVAKVTRQGAIPFAWIADFNVGADAMESSPILETLNVVVLRPSNTNVTCHQGSGTLIGYVICSRSALLLLRLEAVPEVPWAPRDGLRMKVRRDAKDIQVVKYAKPISMGRAQEQATLQPEDITWEEALRRGREETRQVNLRGSDGLEVQRQAAAKAGSLEPHRRG